MLKKPPSIALDDFKSSKWDEITSGRNFSESDIPTLTLLIQWYAVVNQCIDDMSSGDGVQVAYMNDMGDLKALPQLTTMKQASAEIRALNKQLGINDEAKPQVETKESVISVFSQNRKDRSARAKRTG